MMTKPKLLAGIAVAAVLLIVAFKMLSQPRGVPILVRHTGCTTIEQVLKDNIDTARCHVFERGDYVFIDATRDFPGEREDSGGKPGEKWPGTPVIRRLPMYFVCLRVVEESHLPNCYWTPREATKGTP